MSLLAGVCIGFVVYMNLQKKDIQTVQFEDGHVVVQAHKNNQSFLLKKNNKKGYSSSEPTILNGPGLG